MDNLSKFKPKDMIVIKDGFVSYGYSLPGFVLDSIPEKGGWQVRYLGADGQIYEKPQRWFRKVELNEQG